MSEACGGAVTLPQPFRLVAHDTLPSTSDEAKALASSGAAHGTLVWAREQTHGRGRLDRSWVSPRGNLFMSVVLRPEVPPAQAAEVGFVAALAVSDAVLALLPARAKVTLKWPNDVLADGGKIAGILLEARSAPSGLVDWLVLGIGINIVAAPTDTPYPTAYLQALGARQLDVETVLEQLSAALAARLESWQARGFAPIRTDWLDRARGLGERLEIRHGGTPIAGRFIDLDLDGALILETASGTRRITAGDVYFPVS
jgi:BirA family biotin operon repressor/biotin-[acetyl-CoA-carboxylase] ligase